jgi:hypothetical protein
VATAARCCKMVISRSTARRSASRTHGDGCSNSNSNHSRSSSLIYLWTRLDPGPPVSHVLDCLLDPDLAWQREAKALDYRPITDLGSGLAWRSA